MIQALPGLHVTVQHVWFSVSQERWQLAEEEQNVDGIENLDSFGNG